MPNTRPPTADAEQVRVKREIAEANSFVDFGIIGLFTQDNYKDIVPMAEEGVVGFKVFMGETIGNIPAPDDGQLFESLALMAERTGLRCGFHAENDQILQHMIQKLKAEGRTDPRAHRDSRPVVSEVESVSRPRIIISEYVNKGRMSLNKYVELTSWNPSHVWQVYPQKGAIQVGTDADLSFVDLDQPWKIDRFQLHSKNKVTPFHDWEGKGMPI